MVELARRSFITGLIAFGVTAPAIVRATSIMPVRVMAMPSIDEMVALLSRRIDAANEAFTNNRRKAIYSDVASSYVPGTDDRLYNRYGAYEPVMFDATRSVWVDPKKRPDAKRFAWVDPERLVKCELSFNG